MNFSFALIATDLVIFAGFKFLTTEKSFESVIRNVKLLLLRRI